MRTKKVFLSVILALFMGDAMAQCTILSDSTVCLDEPIGFALQSSSTVSGISWDFGDGNSSSQVNPFHRYTTTGKKTVEATVTFSGGGGCVVTKDIYVHDPPQVSVSLAPNSNFCLKDNNVCINDATKTGTTGAKLTRRVVLWGDGNKTETINPVNGSVCHKYLVAGNYTITVEVTNDKGCSEFKEIDVEVFPNYTPSFFLDNSYRRCTGVTFCLENDSTSGNPLVEYFRWDFSDGGSDTTDLLKVCHEFTQNGLAEVRLVTRTTDGCINEVKHNYFVSIPVVNVDVQSDSIKTKCYPAQWDYVQTPDQRYKYGWSYRDSSGLYSDVLGEGNAQTFSPPDVGVFYLLMFVQDDQCVKFYRDTVRVIGVKAGIMAFNNYQCISQDTVFVCQKSNTFRTDSLTYFWSFGDSIAPQCTTDTYQPSPTYNNCNFWWGEQGKHLYNFDSCSSIRLVAYDHINGCVDSTEAPVVIGFTEKEDYEFEADNFCEGIDAANGIRFLKPECGNRETYINFDSLCDRKDFYSWSAVRLYPSTCHPDGWVTVGIATVNGESKIYRSCDTNDYYIDSSRICYDTFWYHNWFRLDPTPAPSFNFKVETCVPAAGQVTLDFPKQRFVRNVYYDWGDGKRDTTRLPDNYDSIPGLSHTYRDAIEFELHVTMVTDSGCKATSLTQNSVGYFNGMNLDTSVCINFEQTVYDSLFYWDTQADRPWRDTSSSKPETLIWDLDDGRGFSTTGPKPKISYPQRGIYTIRMASEDKNGCRDTAVQNIYVGGSKSGIKKITKHVVCDDAVQFFDSSITPTAEDSVIQHKWLFGDGRAPSYLENPFHFYSIFGEYEITHIITSANGCVDTSKAILVVDGPSPSFDIVSDTVGCAPYTVEFDNTSKNVGNYIWYFGDQNNSTLSTSQDTNVTFTYTLPGTYYISLYGSDSVVDTENNGIRFCQGYFPDTAIKPYPVRKIIVVPVPPADFDMPSEVCAGEEFTLVDRSDATYREFVWYISNGDTVKTNQQNGKYRFTQPGQYSVFYRPTYVPRGPYMRQCYDTVTKNITVRELPEADFILDSLDCDGNALFINQSTGAVTYLWSFDDPGITDSDSIHPVVTFTDSGSHTVQLIAKNQYDCADTADLVVDFDPKNKVSAGLTMRPISGCMPMRVQFTNIPPYQQNFWNFGDGLSLSDTSVGSHVYDTAGVYDFTYIAIDPNSCNVRDTFNTTVTVDVRPVAGFMFSTNYCNGEVKFTNLSLNGKTYLWDFGNGQTSREKDPVVQFGSDGLYTITLTVNDTLLCRSSFVNKVQIQSTPDTNLLVPNVFTPGYDAFNPCYQIQGVDPQCYIYKLRIYNRWGSVIFESDDVRDCWDGNDSETFVEYPSGTYFYILDLTDKSTGEHERITGSITMIRE